MSFKQTASQKPRGYPNSWNVRENEPVYTNRSNVCRRCRSEMIRCCCANGGCPEWRMMLVAWRNEGEEAPRKAIRPCSYCAYGPCEKAIKEGWY